MVVVGILVDTPYPRRTIFDRVWFGSGKGPSGPELLSKAPPPSSNGERPRPPLQPRWKREGVGVLFSPTKAFLAPPVVLVVPLGGSSYAIRRRAWLASRAVLAGRRSVIGSGRPKGG